MKGILLLAVIHLFIIYQSQKKKAEVLPSSSRGTMETMAFAGNKSALPLAFQPLLFSRIQPNYLASSFGQRSPY